MSAYIRASVKLTLIDVIEKQSHSYAINLWSRVNEFHDVMLLEAEEVVAIRLSDLLGYRDCLTESTAWKLGHIRILLERADRLGYGIATPEALAYLSQAVIRGNPKGNDVRTRDPNKGAFTTLELEELNAALNDGFVLEIVSLPDFTLCHLLLAYGVRSKQLAALKECDLFVGTALDGSRVFSLRIPRAKQQGELTRKSLKTRPCDARLGALLQRHMTENDRVKSSLEVTSVDAPMFISMKRGELPGFDYHCSSQELTRKIFNTFDRVSPVHANSKRFRHTLAKRAHDDGADIYVIAELLDHSDIQNAKVYTEGSPDIIDRLNRSMAMELAPVAQSFAGLLIRRDDIEAKQAGPQKRIHDRILPNGRGADPLGNCGMHGFCGLARPVACYTCRNFRPWDDGPHEEVLESLLADRERQRTSGYAPRIFGLHDRTITAVARVILLCEERRTAGNSVST